MSSLKVSTVLFTVLIYVIAEDAKPIATATEGHNDKGFFQYANVPVPNEYVFGYNRDSDLHQISRFQQVKDRTFQTKVKWSDGYEGQGEHVWDYNHDTSYSNPSPAYSTPTSIEVPSSLQAPEPAYPAPTPAPAPSYSSPKTTLPLNSIPIANSEEEDDEPVPVYIPKRQRNPTAAPSAYYPKVVVPPYQPKKSFH